jgi:hypothetical protein
MRSRRFYQAKVQNYFPRPCGVVDLHLIDSQKQNLSWQILHQQQQSKTKEKGRLFPVVEKRKRGNQLGINLSNSNNTSSIRSIRKGTHEIGDKVSDDNETNGQIELDPSPDEA